MSQTKLSNLINAEVFSGAVSTKLGDAIKLYGLSFVESFAGQQSGTIKVPKYSYIGDADVVAEGVAIDPSLLSQTSEDISVVKVGKAVNITDEAANSAFGDPVGQAENQLTKAIASGIEKQMFSALGTATLVYNTVSGASLNTDVIASSLELFGEDQDGAKYLLVNPTQLTQLRKNPDFIKEPNNGVVDSVGEIFTCQVVVSNRVPAGVSYIVKPEAVALYISNAVQVETQRDILAKATVISADEFFATHLRDASKAVKIAFTA